MIILGSALNVHGDQIPAHGVEVGGNFIVNARISACGRFHAAPADHGLTEAEANELAALNAGKDLMAYWDL